MVIARDKLNRNGIARAVGVDPAHVSRILSGKANPSLSLASRIAEHLGITLDDFWELLKDSRS